MIGLIGTALGVLLGYGIAAVIISPNGMMSTYFDLPDWALIMPSFCVPLLIATVALLTLISFLSVKKMLHGTAADALLPLYAKDHAKACDGKTVPLGETVFWNQMEPAGCAPA